MTTTTTKNDTAAMRDLAIGNPIMVHSDGEEGVITIDDRTGRVLTKLDDMPSWAEGLAVAVMHERTRYYAERIGEMADKLAKDGIDARDFSWVAVDGEGNTVEVEADEDYRRSVLGTILGIDMETGEPTDATLVKEFEEAETDLKAPNALDDGGVSGTYISGLSGPDPSEAAKEAANG